MVFLSAYISAWRLEDSKKADEKSGTDFTRSWQSIAHRKGYVLIVQIAGIGQ